MKFLIVFACLLAVAFAQHHEHHEHHDDTKVVKQEAEVNHDSFKYAYELDNHIKAHQEGSLHDKDNWIVAGEYEYVAPHGEHIHVTYKADDHGYHPTVHF